MQFTKSLIPRQTRRNAQLVRSSTAGYVSGPLTRCHVLLVVERKAQDSGEPAPADLIAGLRSHGVRVGVLDCYSTIADLVGHRITGRPDVVIGMLPGRGPALAAIRAARRLDAPLIALVSHDGPTSWGESSTLRRAARVVITREDLRGRVQRCGVQPDRIDVWHSFTPTAMRVFEQLAEHSITQHRRAAAAPGGPMTRTFRDS